jgi:hypothetical protein
VGWSQEASEDARQRSLAGAGFAHDADSVARIDGYGSLRDRQDRAVPNRDVAAGQ